MLDRRVGQQLLVVGPGWLGRAAALALSAEGADVWTLQRSAITPPLTSRPVAGVDGAYGTITALRGDIRTGVEPSDWLSALPNRLDGIVLCIAPSRAAGDSHQSTYPAAVRGVLALARARACRWLVYTSSTGVYGRSDGGESRESDTLVAHDERQQALIDAERLMLNEVSEAASHTVLRVAGLYGPGRDPAARFRTAVPSGADDVWCNFSWRDDVISAIAFVMTDASAVGTSRVYNCADGTPLRSSTIARALGAPDVAEGASFPPARSPSGRSNQRIVTDALRATGWSPQMPTVLDGLRALGHHPTEDATP